MDIKPPPSDSDFADTSMVDSCWLARCVSFAVVVFDVLDGLARCLFWSVVFVVSGAGAVCAEAANVIKQAEMLAAS